ncbi:MAG: DUF262 domain-containing protein [Bacilli bacterium]
MDNELRLKSINELLNESFHIPSYQRGYRWTKRQVTELLNDLEEFQKNSENKSPSLFYCLQPIVVKNDSEQWELVDGQQRLTTIYIILDYLRPLMEMLSMTPYSLRYETRIKSEHFLKNINKEDSEANIDFFHIYQAKEAIKEWFDLKGKPYKIKMLQCLLNDNETGKNVKVIWYEINESIDSTVVFTRLNLGKIPLSNAELVKALFLQDKNFQSDESDLLRLKIASEWDFIEKELQKDEFWYFFNQTDQQSNRIESILRLIALIDLKEYQASLQDEYFIFLTFNDWLKSKKYNEISQFWSRVKKYFLILQEWYDDRNIYHMIGFLIARDTKVSILLEVFIKSKSKIDFIRKLKNLSFEKVFKNSSTEKILNINKEKLFEKNKEELKIIIKNEIQDLKYYKNKTEILSILLLFNIISLLESQTSNARFQFDKFKIESWDIEHISPISKNMPNNNKKRREWINEVENFINGEVIFIIDGEIKVFMHNILKSINEIKEKDGFESDDFTKLFNDFQFGFINDQSDLDVDSLGNLTLLNSSINRSYQNAIFPIKRKKIINLDKTSIFIPLATKNVFLKYYSSHINRMMEWSKQDSEDYLESISEKVFNFFGDSL